MVVVEAATHAGLQRAHLLVVGAPLGHDAHGGRQLGLLRHRVVALMGIMGNYEIIH